jgi:hypothetical protein
VKVNPSFYRVDGEIGRFRFPTYRMEEEGAVLFDSGRELFPALNGEEWYLTRGFKEISMFYGVAKRSYRETTEVVNRMRRVEEATPMRSLREQSEREGARLQKHLEEKTRRILSAHGIGGEEQASVNKPEFGPEQSVEKAALEVAEAIAACAQEEKARQEMESNPVPYEDPNQSVNVSVDDVGVKRQKARRVKGGQSDSQEGERKEEAETEEKKRVHTTVAHVETKQGNYVLSGLGVVALLKQVLAFLLANGLTTRTLVVFVDGQRSLYKAVTEVLGRFRNWRVILDWYYLEKRCREDLSMALKGRAIRNELLDELLPLLWDGRVSSALEYLEGVNPEKIKSQQKLTDLIGYLKRQRPHIPCYSVRKKLGLCNSSNRGEKQNDLVVATRQKHNGMSWSPCGSIALSSLATAARNEEIIGWFETGEIKFELASAA